jgi:hypothetical protein
VDLYGRRLSKKTGHRLIWQSHRIGFADSVHENDGIDISSSHYFYDDRRRCQCSK